MAMRSRVFHWVLFGSLIMAGCSGEQRAAVVDSPSVSDESRLEILARSPESFLAVDGIELWKGAPRPSGKAYPMSVRLAEDGKANTCPAIRVHFKDSASFDLSITLLNPATGDFPLGSLVMIDQVRSANALGGYRSSGGWQGLAVERGMIRVGLFKDTVVAGVPGHLISGELVSHWGDGTGLTEFVFRRVFVEDSVGVVSE